MKQWIVLILLIPAVAFAQNAGKSEFVIKGSITGLPEKSVITLNDLNNPTDTVARAEVKNGSFVLKGSVAEPNLYQLNFNAIQKKGILFLSNNTITVNGTVDNIQSLEVSGSTVQQDFKDFQNTFNPLFQKLAEMNQQLSGSPEAQRNDSVMKTYMGLIQRIKTTVDEFVSNKRTSPIASFALVVTDSIASQQFTQLILQFGAAKIFGNNLT